MQQLFKDQYKISTTKVFNNLSNNKSVFLLNREKEES